MVIRVGTRQANPRYDRDWSSGTSRERRGRGELHKARYDADAAAIRRGTPVVRDSTGSRNHVDIVAVRKDR